MRRFVGNQMRFREILTNLNHGFRSGYSCETQLVVTLQDLCRNYDNGKQTDIAILDFSKAFDTVPHPSLLYKLQSYGVKGNLHSWLQNFLTKRLMRVVVDGEESVEVPVDSGYRTRTGPIPLPHQRLASVCEVTSALICR
ncbi:uncharacterized protein [Littorina saxatilis]|uniref:uncharacterized protein n=1 Tax=Littorina saxatilis TaxID=31220 RepID=UPI0038B58B85